MYRLFIILFISLLSHTVIAAEKRDTGFKLDVTVKGFFSPEVTSAVVKSVSHGSVAESKGVKVGDKLLAIADCKIPGCPANIAKDHISQAKGTLVNFLFSPQNGEIYMVTIPLM